MSGQIYVKSLTSSSFDYQVYLESGPNVSKLKELFENSSPKPKEKNVPQIITTSKVHELKAIFEPKDPVQKPEAKIQKQVSIVILDVPPPPEMQADPGLVEPIELVAERTPDIKETANQYFEQLLHNSKHHLDEIIYSHHWFLEDTQNLLDVIKERFPVCSEDQKKAILEFLYRLTHNNPQDLEERHLYNLIDMLESNPIERGFHVRFTAFLLKNYAFLQLRQRVKKRMGFQLAERVIRVTRHVKNWEFIKNRIIKNQDSSSDLKQMAEDFKKYSIRMLSDLKRREFANAAWNKNVDRCQNLRRLIHSVNKIGNWVTLEILSCSEIKERVRLTRFFAKLCQQAWNHHDWNTAAAIAAALNNGYLSRLQNTWRILKKTDTPLLEEIERIKAFFFMNRVLPQHLERLKNNEREIQIPFLGTFLSAFTSANEMEQYTPVHAPNPAKVEVIARLQQIISQCQAQLPTQKLPYTTRVIDLVETTSSQLDDEMCYQLSKQREPNPIAVGA